MHKIVSLIVFHIGIIKLPLQSGKSQLVKRLQYKGFTTIFGGHESIMVARRA